MLSSALLIVALMASPTEPIRLTPGGQEVLRIPGLTRIALSKEEIADVKVLNNGELLVLGKQKGRTTITMWIHGRVSSRAVVVDDGRSSELARLIDGSVSPGLKVEEYNGRVVVDGIVDSVEDLERLKLLVGSDPNVTLLVTLNPRVLPVVAEMITTQLQREGIKTARAVCVGGKLFLEGSVSDQAESQKAQLIADAIYARASGGR
jgi:Flp pilus assembly secretin CpaC